MTYKFSLAIFSFGMLILSAACTTERTIIVVATQPATNTALAATPTLAPTSTMTPAPLPTETPIPPTVAPAVQQPAQAVPPDVLNGVCANMGGCKCVPFDLLEDGMISYFEFQKYGLTQDQVVELELSYEKVAGRTLVSCQL